MSNMTLLAIGNGDLIRVAVGFIAGALVTALVPAVYKFVRGIFNK